MNLKNATATVTLVLLLFSVGTVSSQKPTAKVNPNNQKSESTSGNHAKIIGTVFDKATNLPVDYATIALFRKDSTVAAGGVCNESGQFILTEVPYGQYDIKIRFVGYNSTVLKAVKIGKPSIDLGQIAITPSTNELGGITVIGHQNDVVTNIDKKVYNISNSIYQAGGTALDIMQSLPAVQVDFNGNVSMRGANITILIDGRPSNLVSLDQLPASLIERVELISNPSAKYDPEGSSGIINIIMKKNVQKGLNGLIGITAGWNNKWLGNASLNYNKKKFNFYTNYTLRSFHGDSYQDFWSLNSLNGYQTHQQKYAKTTNNYTMQNIQLGIDYAINKKNTIETYYTFQPRNVRTKGTTNNIYTENGVNTYNYLAQPNIKGSNPGGFEYDINYKHSFDRKDAELTAEGNISQSNNKSTQELIEQYTKITNTVSILDNIPHFANSSTSSSTKTTRMFFKTDFVLPMDKKGKLEGGYQITNTDSRMDNSISKSYSTDSLPVPMPAYNNNFNYSQLVNALYAIYSLNVGKSLKIQAGIRAEHTNANGNQLTENVKFTKNYIDFFPSAFFKYDINENNELGINYSRRLNRPQIWALNPYVNKTDSLNITKGNPQLDPEYVNSLELGYTYNKKKNTVTITGFYRKTTNVITMVRTPLSNLQSLTTYYNLNSIESYGGEASANILPFKFWNLNLNYSFFRIAISDKGSNILNNGPLSSNSWTARATSSFYLSKDFVFQLIYSYKSPTITAGAASRGPQTSTQGKMESIYSLDAGCRYTIFKGKVDLSVRASDIFNTNKYKAYGYGTDYISYTNNWREAPVLFFGVQYKFNNYKQKKQQKQDDNNDYDYGF